MAVDTKPSTWIASYAFLRTMQAKYDSFSAANKPQYMQLSTSATLTTVNTSVQFTGSSGTFTITTE